MSRSLLDTNAWYPTSLALIAAITIANTCMIMKEHPAEPSVWRGVHHLNYQPCRFDRYGNMVLTMTDEGDVKPCAMELGYENLSR